MNPDPAGERVGPAVRENQFWTNVLATLESTLAGYGQSALRPYPCESSPHELAPHWPLPRTR